MRKQIITKTARKKNVTKRATYRKKTRELLVRILFQMAATGDYSDAAKDAFLSDASLYVGDVRADTPPGCIFDAAAGEGPDLPYLEWVFACARDHLADIDRLIEGASVKWSVPRMSAVDLAILRVALAEILYVMEIDERVSANEAVILAQKYGSERSSAFINGILGTITRARSGGGEDGESGGQGA